MFMFSYPSGCSSSSPNRSWQPAGKPAKGTALGSLLSLWDWMLKRAENTFGVVAPPKLAGSLGSAGFCHFAAVLLARQEHRGAAGGCVICPSCRKCLLPGGQTAHAAAEQARFGHQFCGRWERLQKSRPTR